MSWTEGIAKAGEFAKNLVLITERLDKLQATVDKQGEIISGLRVENAQLSERVAILEEARKTTAAEVKAAMTEVFANQKLEDMQRRLELAEAKAASRQIADN